MRVFFFFYIYIPKEIWETAVVMLSKPSQNKIKINSLVRSKLKAREEVKMPWSCPTMRMMNYLTMYNKMSRPLYHPTTSHKSKKHSINTSFFHNVVVKKSLSFSKKWNPAQQVEILTSSSKAIKVELTILYSKECAKLR